MKMLRGTGIAVVSVLAALLASCGVDESTSGGASPGSAPVPPVADDRGSNPADQTVSSLGLETSLSYDAATNQVLAFYALRDQDGSSIQDFKIPDGIPGFALTGRNFTITLFPGSSSARPLDAQTFDVGTQFRDNKVIALVIDVSGSMSEDAGNGETKLTVAKEVAKNFVDAILGTPGSGDLMALLEFSTDATILSPLTDDPKRLKDLIDGMETKDATNFGGALAEAVRAVGIQPGKRGVVFLTDGADTVDGVSTGAGVSGDWPAWEQKSASLRWQAMQKLVDYELVTYTIGFGAAATGADADLRAFADATGGQFYPAATATDLNEAFDPALVDSIPARVEGLAGVTSPFVSFPNEYSAARGPIGVKLTLSFQNGNGTLSAQSLGTYTVSGN
jgi:Mg-chelatase subunit ChlD